MSTEILEKIQTRLSGWSSKLLSQAGRTTPIKPVESSILSYTMSSLSLPKSVYRTIDSQIKNFWWGFNHNKKSDSTPKAWHFTCQPKYRGGLGIKQTSNFNYALISKIGWNLTEKKKNKLVSPILFLKVFEIIILPGSDIKII